jgi:hypothetical protein
MKEQNQRRHTVRKLSFYHHLNNLDNLKILKTMGHLRPRGHGRSSEQTDLLCYGLMGVWRWVLEISVNIIPAFCRAECAVVPRNLP